MKELREYQNKIVEQVINSDKDLVICLPTGAGKTVIASKIIELLPGTVLFVVPRLELIDQARREFEFPTDIVHSNKTQISGFHCIVASKDSLRTQLTKLPDGDYTLIFDEAHIGIEQSFNLVQAIRPRRVLGLTATPERMDGYALLKGKDDIHKFGIFDELLTAETVPSLIRKGYLVPLHYYAKPIENITDIKPDNKMGDELSGSQMTKIFNEHGIWGDLVSTYETYGKGRPAIGFTTTIDMAEQVSALFNDEGYDFRVITGKMTVNERKELIDALKNREIDGLINAALLTYGFDCPEASYAFSCRHIKSRPLWFQMIGRILRLCEGKKDAIFIDHGDSISEFSEPDCTLPIMDERIVWRADGESKTDRQLRKLRLKKVQDSMKIIQEYDPLPAEMVEITTEDTWERQNRIILKLISEKRALLNENSALKIEQTKQLRAMMIQKEENEKLKMDLKKQEKVVDTDKTFEFIKKNYAFVRRIIEDEYHDHSKEEHHKLTVAKLEQMEDKQSFYFDMRTFRNSTTWWKDHYTSDYTPKIHND